MICLTEKISLCTECGRSHKTENSTKHHEIARLQDLKLICENCLDSSIPGYGFCSDCTQSHPKVLCLSCTERHCATKEYESHKICTDLELMKPCEK